MARRVDDPSPTQEREERAEAELESADGGPALGQTSGCRIEHEARGGDRGVLLLGIFHDGYHLSLCP